MLSLYGGFSTVLPGDSSLFVFSVTLHICPIVLPITCYSFTAVSL